MHYLDSYFIYIYMYKGTAKVYSMIRHLGTGISLMWMREDCVAVKTARIWNQTFIWIRSLPFTSIMTLWQVTSLNQFPYLYIYRWDNNGYFIGFLRKFKENIKCLAHNRQSVNDSYYYCHIFILFYSCGQIIFPTSKSL